MLHHLNKCCTFLKTTDGLRHVFTETDDLIIAPDAADTLWPHAKGKPAELRCLVIHHGARVVEDDVQVPRNKRLAAISHLVADLDNVWPSDWTVERNKSGPHNS